MRRYCIILLLTIFCSATCAASGAQTVPGSIEVADLAVPSGGTERVLFIAAQPARATVILLAGGDAVLAIDNAGTVTPGGNFSRSYPWLVGHAAVQCCRAGASERAIPDRATIHTGLCCRA